MLENHVIFSRLHKINSLGICGKAVVGKRLLDCTEKLTSEAPAAPRARPSAAAWTTKPTVAVVALESEIVLSVSPLNDR